MMSTSVALTACSKEDLSTPSNNTTQYTEPQKILVEPTGDTLTEETLTGDSISLEQIATNDAEGFLDALKRKDIKLMSSLMAHAENEYTPETMQIIYEGFQLQFDKVAELQLSFDSNAQSDEYFIENFVIKGMKNGEMRFIPFQVKYDKNNGMPTIQDDDQREPLFESPLITQYPYTLRESEKYLQALLDEDVESLLLHLGLYDNKEEAEPVVRKMLETYRDQLDLTTTKVIYTYYDEQKKLFMFDFQDGKGRSHSIHVDAHTWTIVDDWVSKKSYNGS